MPFKTKTGEYLHFDDLPSIEKYAEMEAENFIMVPIENFVENKARFLEDQFYGREKFFVKFNEDGIKSFCRVCGIPYDFIKSLKEKGLTSRVINDYLNQDDLKKRLTKYNFVMDKTNNTVSGVVSRTYVGYSVTTKLKSQKADGIA